MRFLLNFFLIFLLFNSSSAIAERIGCKDENGNLVEWFYLYKLPNKFNNAPNSGLEYLYLTNNSMDSWTRSKNLINSTSSLAGKTLDFIYTKDLSDFLVAMYNDEPTNGNVDNNRGHTKGVVAANDISGFWMVHSVPKFPPALGEKYDYPHTGTMYGQSFLCMSFTSEQIDYVGKQLMYNEPHFYSTHVPGFLKTIFPHMIEALKMEEMTVAPYYNTIALKSRHNTIFTSFAKSREFKKELYEDYVAPHYGGGSFYVETWRHGPGNINSDCSKPSKVFNIEDLKFTTENIEFSTLHDHSKWMVSVENDLICVGDINRQEHQKVRGGGTVCMKNEKIANAYGNLVKEVEKCEKIGGDKVVEIIYKGNNA